MLNQYFKPFCIAGIYFQIRYFRVENLTIRQFFMQAHSSFPSKTASFTAFAIQEVIN